MRKIFICLFVFVALSLVSPLGAHAQKTDSGTLEAVVLNVTTPQKTASSSAMSETVQEIKVKVTSTQLKGKILTIDIPASIAKKNVAYSVGDRVVVSYSKGPNGTDQYYITDFVRTYPLLYLFSIFLILVVIIGRKKGFLSFLGMIYSFFIIANFIIPQILLGNDPLLISLLGSIFILPATFYIGHGISKHTTMAVVGTFISLIITGFLAFVFVQLTKLTGFAAEEATYVQLMSKDMINIQSLLLAGIMIGTMGIMDDVTISQTSIVEKLSEANPKYSFRQLYKTAMDVGRDHIASLVNTLILVYAGASLPLFLLFYNTKLSYGMVVNQEIIATEVVRTLVASIGIIMAVPITTLLACAAAKRK